MTRRYLRLILLFAAALRLALLAAAWNHPRRVSEPDSAAYVRLAESLAGENAFRPGGQALPGGQARHGGRAEIFRTPGYPLFLIPSFALRADYWRAAVAAQILLDVLLVYLTFILASMLAGARAGLIAALFQAISTVSVVSSVRILSDGLYALLFTLAVLLMVHHLKSAKWWSLLGSAGVLAAACYVRPVGIVMAALFAAVLLFRPKRFRRAGAMLGIVAAAILPWVIRNHVNAGYPGFSSSFGDAMYFFAVPELKARTENGDPAAIRRRLKAEDSAARSRPDAPPPGCAAVERRRMAIEAIAEHPWTYAGLHVRGCLGVYLPAAPGVLETAGVTKGQQGTSDVLREAGPLAAARHYFGGNIAAVALAAPMVLLLAVKYLAVAACAIKNVRLRMPAEGWLILAAVIVTTLLPGPFGLPRYRAPVAPLLSAAAGAGLLLMIDLLRRRRGLRSRPASEELQSPPPEDPRAPEGVDGGR